METKISELIQRYNDKIKTELKKRDVYIESLKEAKMSGTSYVFLTDIIKSEELVAAYETVIHRLTVADIKGENQTEKAQMTIDLLNKVIANNLDSLRKKGFIPVHTSNQMVNAIENVRQSTLNKKFEVIESVIEELIHFLVNEMDAKAKGEYNSFEGS